MLQFFSESTSGRRIRNFCRKDDPARNLATHAPGVCRAVPILAISVIALFAVSPVVLPNVSFAAEKMSQDDSNVSPMTVQESLVIAYLNNPSLLGRRATLRGVDEGVSQALANWRPDVSVNVDAGFNRVTNPNSSVVVQQRRPFSMGMSITQPLFRGGRTLAEVGNAEKTVMAGRARLMSVEQDIMLEVVTVFSNVFRDMAVINLNKNNELVLKRQLEATRDRFEVGEITRTDVYQAEARLAEAVADRISSEGDLEVSRAAYQNVVGEPAPARLFPAEMPDIGLDTKEQVVKAAVLQNPDVIEAGYVHEATIAAIDEVWGELLPSLDLTADFETRVQQTSVSDRSQTADFILNLTIPIFQQGEVYSRLREAKQDAAKTQLDVDQARRDAVELATTSWERILTSRARVDSLSTAINASMVALEGVEREAAVGSRTVLDVLDAEQELLDSRVNLVRAQRDEVVVLYELLASVGKLTARDLQLPVELYDPTAHYKEVREMYFGGSSQGGVE